MIYLDNGATSFPKPVSVRRAVVDAMARCANPGRGGYREAMEAARVVYRCREKAGALFECPPDRVVFTGSCTQGLNMAIRTLVKPGSRVVVSGFEHNAVMRPLYALDARIQVAGRKLFDWEDTLRDFRRALEKGADTVVFTHVSNAFGYVLPIAELSRMCREFEVPFVMDCAQSAGSLPVSLEKSGAAFIAMPGHKGLQGPQGTGLLLCGRDPEPLLYGGTGSQSMDRTMPETLPERGEAGTLNVPGIAGLWAGLSAVEKTGLNRIASRERTAADYCAEGLVKMGMTVFSGPNRSGCFSFLPPCDCETFSDALAEEGIAVRAGLHCAPLAHESAGTLKTGTVRVSFGMDAALWQCDALLKTVKKVITKL